MNIFTNDDYRRIQAWLKANAIKDSDFAISENTVPDKDILVITQNMSTVPTNYKIKIKDLLNSSLGKVVIDKITANIVKVNNSLTVDTSKVILNNEKGTTLQDVLNYFEGNKLNRHTDDTFDGNLTIKKNITIEGNIKSHDDTITVEADLEATGEITDGHGNLLNDVNSAAKQWSLEYQDPQQDEPTVRAKYVLKDYRGVPKGSVIKVYKDSAITNVYLGTVEDTCNPNTGEVTKHPIHDNNEALSIVYRLNTGKYSLVNVPIKMFVTEAEFDKYRGLGVTSNGQVFIKLASDVESSNYLHFNELGEITADGIENRILRDLGNIITSVAGDGTMWGVYKEHEGTQKTSTPNDGSRWGEFKRAEEIREQTSDSAHTVFSDNWDEQDDDPEEYDPLAVTEASYAYNWKSTDGTKQGNLGDLAEEFNNLSTKVPKLEKEIYNKFPSVIDSTDDLYITDKYGHVLVEFKEGHIKTKEFDSKDINKNSTYSLQYDKSNNLYITDDTKNAIFGVVNGQIISKYFYHQLFGKRFSVIGDSISTFAYSVSGDYSGCSNPNANYYQSAGTDVHTPDDTWFGQLAKKSNAIINRVASYGGGDVVKHLKNYYDKIYSMGTMGAAPDYIFIFAGINDVVHNSTLGSIEDFVDNDTTTFKGAYCYLLDKLQSTFPFSTIIAMTPIYSAYFGGGIPFTVKNSLGLTTRDYAEAIIECCKAMGVKYIDTNLECEINRYNYQNFMFDYTHPNKEGLGMIANVVFNNLK